MMPLMLLPADMIQRQVTKHIFSLSPDFGRGSTLGVLGLPFYGVQTSNFVQPFLNDDKAPHLAVPISS
jgi:hypothetical protein